MMQQLRTQTLQRLNVGINSRMIKETANGPIFSEEVDLIEVGINESGVLKNGEVDRQRLDAFSVLRNKFSVHGPFLHDYNGNDVNLCVKSNRNFEVLRNVFEVADYLDAEHVVLHAEKIEGAYSEAFANAVANFKQVAKMASEQNITLLIENLHKERSSERIGVNPQEILQVIKAVDEPNLKYCFDIGHANLSANQFGFDVLDFVRVLSPYLVHMHIHDNIGIPETVDPNCGDQHLPLGQGKVDYPRIFQAINGLGVKNTVLELRRDAGRAAAIKSISILRALQGKKASYKTIL